MKRKRRNKKKDDRRKLEILLQKAEESLSEEQLDAALELLDEALDLDPQDATALDLFYRVQHVRDVGGTWFEDGDFEEAVEEEAPADVIGPEAEDEEGRSVQEEEPFGSPTSAVEEQVAKEEEASEKTESTACAQIETQEEATRELTEAEIQIREATLLNAQRLVEEQALTQRHESELSEPELLESELLETESSELESSEPELSEPMPTEPADSRPEHRTEDPLAKNELEDPAPPPAHGKNFRGRAFWVLMVAVLVWGLWPGEPSDPPEFPLARDPAPEDRVMPDRPSSLEEQTIPTPPPTSPRPSPPTASPPPSDPQTNPQPDAQTVPSQTAEEEEPMVPVVELEDAPTSLRSSPRPVFLSIAGGQAAVGCVNGDRDCFTDEKPVRRERLRSFSLAATETTNRQYAACVKEGACRPLGRKDLRRSEQAAYPVVGVSWIEAVAFCRWLGGRLPTEAEWEYAARGGRSNRRYPWGFNIARDQANYGAASCCTPDDADGYEGAAPVASFAEARAGLYDLAGNVGEWTADTYGAMGEIRVVKGGSWMQPPEFLRVSARLGRPTVLRSEAIGFRCVGEAP